MTNLLNTFACVMTMNQLLGENSNSIIVWHSPDEGREDSYRTSTVISNAPRTGSMLELPSETQDFTIVMPLQNPTTYGCSTGENIQVTIIMSLWDPTTYGCSARENIQVYEV